MRLEGKAAVVTGFASGIGRAIADRFVAEGAAVLGVDRNRDAGERAAAEIAAAGGNVAFFYGDVSLEEDVRGMVEACLQRFGRLDILVNNAGIEWEVPLHETTNEQWRAMIDVNLGGVFLGCKYAIPEMIARGGGSIVNISSVLGLVADPKLAVYSATKGGVLAMTRAIAVAYGRQGIRATCICPADVDTPLNRAYFNSFPDPVAARAEIEEEYPLGRIAVPDEVARVAAFLASDESSYITGSHIVVDGGVLSTIY